VTADPIEIRAFEEADLKAVVKFSLRAWEPVFASLRSVLGDEVFLRLDPEWQESQTELSGRVAQTPTATFSSLSWTIAQSPSLPSH
jgi:hypothetical protein